MSKKLKMCDKWVMDAFDENQSDKTLANVFVQWMGQSVRLYTAGGTELLTIKADEFVVSQIKTFCANNHMRCEQIQDGVINL